MAPPQRPAIELFGPALTREDFGGSDTAWNWRQAILACIEVADRSKALKLSGLSRTAFFQALKRFYQSGDISTRTRKSERSVYTYEVLKLAYDLLHDSTSLLDFKDLYGLLQGHGQLLEEGTLERFREAFKHFCHEEGTPLTVGSTSTVFYLAKSDWHIRLQYSKSVLQLLDSPGSSVDLRHFIFVDEVTLEEVPHPKGKHPGMHACMV
mmetsp:Transcript_27898/g.82720  ORF Transcript_27898/g.82720 Transcript_27898/m.82720 type:complete len:209 (-) Transcript_27898:72-698(-)